MQFGRVVSSAEAGRHDLCLYAADTPNSWKISILLEEMEMPYDVVRVDLLKDEQKRPEFIALNPNGRLPTLVDHSATPPFAVFESGAILLYLAEKFGSPLLPTEPTLRSEVQQWLMWQASALGPMLGQLMYFKRIVAPGAQPAELAQVRYPIDRFDREVSRCLVVLETRLAGRDYLAGPDRGRYTLADLACYGHAASSFWAGVPTHDLPGVTAWLARCEGRKATRAGVRCPGISVLGPGAPTFEDLRIDLELQAALESAAKRAGRPYFGWKDLAAIVAAKAGKAAAAIGFSADASSVASGVVPAAHAPAAAPVAPDPELSAPLALPEPAAPAAPAAPSVARDRPDERSAAYGRAALAAAAGAGVAAAGLLVAAAKRR